jgi:hypothetical protein
MHFLHRTVFEYAQSIGDTFGAISGGEFEYFPCEFSLCKALGQKIFLFYRLIVERRKQHRPNFESIGGPPDEEVQAITV